LTTIFSLSSSVDKHVTIDMPVKSQAVSSLDARARRVVYCSKDRLDVAGVDSVTVTVVSSIQFESSEVCDDWIKSIQRNIAAQNALSVRLSSCYGLPYSIWQAVL